MVTRNTAVLLLTLVILSVLTGITGADPVNNSTLVNTLDNTNSTSDDTPGSSGNQTGDGVAATFNMNDKTSVNGKIMNFFKGFNYQSGMNL